MTQVDRSMRIRAFIERRFYELVIVLVILSALSGWWAYQVHMVPEFEQDEVVTESWNEQTNFDHRAEVIRTTMVWDRGEIIENRPLYYFNVTDELEGTYTYEYEADSGDVDVTTNVSLVLRAIDEEEVFWELSESLTDAEESGLSPEENHTTTFTVDIDWILRTIDRVENQLGAREGLVDPRIIVRSDVTGEVEGEPHDASHESDMAVVVNPETFRVAEMNPIDVPHEETEFVEAPIDPPLFEQLGSLAAFNLLILALLALLTGHYTGRLTITEEERELLLLQREREEFDEWITTGTFPADRDYESTILVDELVGLVDVAIDTNNRVIEDEQLGVSTVIDGDIVYVYIHPGSPAREWLITYVDTTIDEFDID